jgi:hypothetical protein
VICDPDVERTGCRENAAEDPAFAEDCYGGQGRRKAKNVSVRVSKCVRERKGRPEARGDGLEEGVRGRKTAKKIRCRRRWLIFRELERFFTIFHRFFTPYFSQNGLIFRELRKIPACKRRTIVF